MRWGGALTLVTSVLLVAYVASGSAQQVRLDANAAGNSQQLTLAVAPSPVPDAAAAAQGPTAELQPSTDLPAPSPDAAVAALAAAQGPAAELQLSTDAAPGAEPSSEPVAIANGTAQLQGAGAALSQQHADQNGGSHVNITLSGLPANYSDVTAACAFPQLVDVQRLETLSLQRTGEADFTAQPDLLAQYLQLVLGLPTSSAVQAFSPNDQCQKPDVCPADGFFNFTAVCGVPPGQEPVVPVVVAQPPQDDSAAAANTLVTLGSATLALQRIRFDGASPSCGPASGNTSIAIQGAGFQEGLQCVYVNATAHPPRWLGFNATIQNSGAASCETPAWPLGNASSISVTMQLAWPDGSVLPMPHFVYYPSASIVELSPASLPRFGDASSTVYAFFSSNFKSTPPEVVAALEPRLRLVAAGVNGSRTVLGASWTIDMAGLRATLPGGGQLAVGEYVVQGSLNGGHNWSGGANGNAAVLTLKGPLVGMASPYYRVAAGQTSVQLSAQLDQPAPRTVTALVSVEQRAADGAPQVQLPADVLSSGQVSWAAGDNSSQAINLTLPQGQSWADRALLVSVTAATDADIDFARAATIVSSAPESDFTVTFEAGYNQVVYPGDNVSVPVTVTGSRIAVPAAVTYQLDPQTPCGAPFLPSFNGSLHGVLRWDPSKGGRVDIAVPVEWSQVPMDAVYRLSAALDPTWNAAVKDHRYQPAVHIFGVHQGTCPPGTYLKTAPGAAGDNGSSVSLGNLTAGTPAQIRDLHLLSAGGRTIELSTQFEPNTTVYGAMVREDVANATLCVESARPGARVTVFNGTNDVLQPVDAPAAAATFSSLTPGRRLNGLLGTKAGACGAGQRTYLLPFALGQNDFDVFITSPSAVGSQGGAADSYGEEQKALRNPGNTTARYSLAVVRLANPEHCQLQSLNATTAAGISLPVCGLPQPAAAQVASSSVATAVAAATAVASAPAPEAEAAAAAAAAARKAQRLGYGPCQANHIAALNLTTSTDYLSLHPGLRFPNIQGVRVEVNGQVLSQGGNLGADRITDTTSAMQVRSNPDFLPAAFIVGLEPGVPLQVPIVIVAEDGVTSLRYYVSVTRDLPSGNATDGSTTDGPGAISLKALPGELSPAQSAVDQAIADSPLSAILSNMTKATLSRVDKGVAAGGGGGADGSDGGISPTAAATAGDSQEASAAASALLAPLPAGWPLPPARQQQCGACVGGWSSTDANASYCTMCAPGSYSPAAFSPACPPCPPGTYASSWGSTHCRHCVTGTFGPSQGGELCLMCPANYTTLADGSVSCDTPVGEGLDLKSRYAVIVSFGVLLNGTALNEIAQRVGVNASSEVVLDTLVRSDTASAFNISLGNVHVTGIEQVSRRVLYVNVSASLPVDVPPGASDDDVRTAFNVKSISADEPIKMLVDDPDKFFGRTTKALNVNAEGDGHGAQRTLSSPHSGAHLALPWPAILGIILGGLLVLALATAVFARRRVRRAYQAVSTRLSAARLPQFRVGTGSGGGGWRLPSAWGMVQRMGSGSSQGSVAASDAPIISAPGGARVRHQGGGRGLLRSHQSDATADVPSQA